MTRIALPHLSAGTARNTRSIALRSFYIIMILSMLLANLALPQQTVSAATKPGKTPAAPVPAPVKKTTYRAPKFEQPKAVKAKPVDDSKPTNVPLYFVENVGQFDSKIQFQALGGNQGFDLRRDGIWVNIMEPETESRADVTYTRPNPTPVQPEPIPTSVPGSEKPRKGVNLHISFDGANPNPNIIGVDPINIPVSFFIGNDPHKWIKNAPVYKSILYVDLYPNVDLVITGENGQITQKLIVKSSVWQDVEKGRIPLSDQVARNDLEPVKLKVDGADSISSSDNELLIKTEVGDYKMSLFEVENESTNPTKLSASLSLTKPAVSNQTISSPFVQNSSEETNQLTNQTTTPGLFFSTFLGGSLSDGAMGTAVDENGDIYIAGTTLSLNFPGTTGEFQSSDAGDVDDFVAKLSADGSRLEYATYLGGSGQEVLNSMALGPNHSIYIGGYTYSTDFPTSANAYDKVRGNPQSPYVAKISDDGANLEYSTLFPQGYIFDIAVDQYGYAYFTGQTDFYGHFPTTSGAYQRSIRSGFYGGVGYHGIVAKLNLDGSGFIYSTLIGGLFDDCEQNGNYRECSIAVDEQGEAVVVGPTESYNFPTTANAYDRVFNGYYDAFVLKLNAAGSGLIFSTFLGGSGIECIYSCAVALGADDSVYVTGQTNSTNFPTTDGAYSRTLKGLYNTFVTKLTPDGSQLAYSTYLGGSGSDDAQVILVNSSGEAYVVGQTDSFDFPITSGAVQFELSPHTCGRGGVIQCRSVFISKLSSDGHKLLYSTYLGDKADDWGNGAALIETPREAPVVVGSTEGGNFPITPGAYDQVFASPTDAFVAELGVPNPISDHHCSPCNGSQDTEDMTASGTQDATQSEAGDPVNTRLGTFYYDKTDLSFQTEVGPLSFTRHYISKNSNSDDAHLGYGWTQNHDIRLIFPNETGGQPGKVIFKSGTGNLYDLIINSDGSYSPGEGTLLSLVQNDGTPLTYTLRDTAQNIYTFNENGRLSSWVDASGHIIGYQYNQDGLLERVNANGGARFIDLSYDGQGRIISVSDHAARSISYSYDDEGNLVTFTDVLGKIWHYNYDANHHLLSIQNPLGGTDVHNEYDDQGRVVNEYDGTGNLAFSLSIGDNIPTTITNALGQTEANQYDGINAIAAISDPLNETTNKRFDFNYRPVETVDPAGHTTSLTWSSDGKNLVAVADAAGNNTSMSYDSHNNLTSVIDTQNNLTQYNYEDPLHPTLLTHSTNALNHNTFYTYTSEGFLESVTYPRGNVTSYTYDDMGQRTSMTQTDSTPWATWDTIVYTYRYDDLGNLTDTTETYNTLDENGNVVQRSLTTHQEYDAAGHILKTIHNYDPNRPQNDQAQWNITTSYEYDDLGRQTKVIDTLGNSTNTVYDGAGRVLQTTDALGNTTTNTYNQAGQMIASTDALNRTTTYQYDAAGRLVSTTDPLDQTTSSAYNPDGTIASTTDAANRVTSYQYDSLKRVIETTDALGNTTHTTYDSAGNILTSTDALGNTTGYEYDALNRLIQKTDPEGGITQNFYDGNSNLIQTIDANGNTTTYAYDSLNRKISETDALGNEISYTYDLAGNQLAVTDPNGNKTRTVYDLLGREIKTIDPQGNATTTQYDALGRVKARSDAEGNTTTYEYDALGHQLSETNALNGITTFTYDAVGNRLTVTDPNGHTTTTDYDVLNRVLKVTDANGDPVVSEYDADGNLISSTNGAGEKTTYQYDAAGRQIKVTDPAGHETDFTYDANGNRTSQKDANGVVTRYEYDALGRLAAVVENYRPGVAADAQTNVRTEYTYDFNGNRLTIKDGNGNVTSFGYDALNRHVSQTDPLGHTTQTSYDSAGNRSQVIDANGNALKYQYNPVNELTSISSGQGDLYSTFNYDPNGQLIQMENQSGITSWNYNAIGRAQSISREFQDQNNSNITHTVGYEYDANGNRTRLIYPDGKTASYSYDTANRLQSVTADWRNSTISYAYDGANRVSNVTLPNGTQSNYSYDPAGDLTGLAETRGNKTFASYQYSYDNAGNRTQAVEQMATFQQVIPTVAVTVKDSTGNPQPGLTVYAFTDSSNTGNSAITDASGVARLILPEGSYRFQTSLNGFQYFSGDNNDCTVLGCQSASITVPRFGEVTVTVQDSSNAPQAGLPVFVFNGDTDTGLEGLSDANGQVTFTLPEGNYRFRSDKNGFQYFSGADNTCSVPTCTSAVVGIPRFDTVAVTVTDSNSAPQAGLTVYAFNGDDNTGINEVTDDNGVASLLLPEGNYRFAASQDGQFYYSGDSNDCTVLGCQSAAISVPAAGRQNRAAAKRALNHSVSHLLSQESGGGTVTVTVVDANQTPQPGLSVNALTSDGSFTGLQETSDANGQASFSLPAGDYVFQVEVSPGTWFSSATNDACTVPDCSSATFTLPVLHNVTVSLKDSNGAPMTGYWINAFEANENINLAAVVDENGQVVFSLPQGNYRFGVDVIGREYFNSSDYDCSVPDCTSATINTPPLYNITVTLKDSNGTPEPGAWITALDENGPIGYAAETDANGQGTIYQLPQGTYHFQAELYGFQYSSGENNDCSTPDCTSETMTTPPFHAVTVTVQNSNSLPQQGLGVEIYNADTDIGAAGYTDQNGQVNTYAPEGDYRFAVNINGVQYFSGADNTCSVPTCTSDTITLPVFSNVTVTVHDDSNTPLAGVGVHVYNGDKDTGNMGYTDQNGQVVFSLSQGSYRFEAELNGSQYFSNTQNDCTMPGCESDDITVPVAHSVTVTVHDGQGAPQAGAVVRVYNGDTDTGLLGASDANGQAIFHLTGGSYRFEADWNGTQYFSWKENHCTVPACQSAAISVPTLYNVTVDLKDSGDTPLAGYWISARQGDTDVHVAAVSDENGQVKLALPSGKYHFVAQVNGQEYSSRKSNDCKVPDCQSDSITAPQYGVVTVSVSDSASNPQTGLMVEAFQGNSDTGVSAVTDDSGQAYLLLPEGNYRFEATLNGLSYFSSTNDDCTVVSCTSAAISVPQFAAVAVTVTDSGSAPVAGVPVYAFTGNTNTNISAVTDPNGQASLLLPEGSYRFEADRNDYRYFSGENNDCSVLGCNSAAITVPVFSNVTVTVQDSNNTPQEGAQVYSLDGDTQVGYAATSDANGQATFSLPAGNYRFRADLHGFQYFSSSSNDCTTPDCSSAGISTPVLGQVTVTDRSSEYAPQAGLPVYAYDGDTYTGVSALTDSDGYANLWLPVGNYHFRSEQFSLVFWNSTDNNCSVPDCNFAIIYMLGTINGLIGQTINYTYDPLYRLTAADYVDGRYFHYNYDAVGNRLSQESKSNPGGNPVSSSYTYDPANRLSGVNGVSYSWDNNGNLLSDGMSSYEYDPFNRLSKVVSGNDTYEYRYDPQGNRVGQAVNGSWTYYDLDLNAGLTTVLTAQDENYLYGLGSTPVAQNDPGDIDYLFTDGLGSVRQVVRGDSYGQVTLTESYDPFGNLLNSLGNGASAFGYAGQWNDSYIKLIDLRSRVYSPEMGRFLTKDSWQGDYNMPMSYNAWLYGYANPVRYTDPSGEYTYDGTYAANYAMEWDHQAGLDPKYDFTNDPSAKNIDFSNQCTLFASSVLYEGGLRDPRPDPIKNGQKDYTVPYWDISILKAGSWNYHGYTGTSWYNTDDFYNFLTEDNSGTVVLKYPNPPQYIGDHEWQNSQLDKNWENALLSVRSLVLPGDLVFYGSSEKSWDHVAIIWGWGLPTSFGPKSDPGSGPSGNEPPSNIPDWINRLRKCEQHWWEYPQLPLRPVVVERSGGIDYTTWRSLDNTYSHINYLEIVHIGNR